MGVAVSVIFTELSAPNITAYLSCTGLLVASGRRLATTVALIVSAGLAPVPVGRGFGFFVTLLTMGPMDVRRPLFAAPGVEVMR